MAVSLHAPARVVTLFVTLGTALTFVGCNAESADFDEAFNVDSDAQNEAPPKDAPTDEDDGDDGDDAPAPPADADPSDEPPAPTGFAHEGTFTGTCTLTDREPFQVDISLDQWGRGFLRRHDIGPVELDAAGITRDGVTTVEAVRAGIVFVALIEEDENGMIAECLELTPTEGEGDGIGCMFTDIGCPHDDVAYTIAASGELTLVRT